MPPSSKAGLKSLSNHQTKIAYVSRIPAGNAIHDRISNYPEFLELLESLRYDHVYPVDLALNERICSISSYDIIISDSGSCCLNAMLFSAPHAVIFWPQSKKLLSDTSDIVTSQHYKSLSTLGRTIFAIPAKSSQESELNPWYDKVEIDIEEFRAILQPHLTRIREE